MGPVVWKDAPLTLRDLILIQQISKGEWAPVVELIQRRADPPPSREELEALTVPELRELITQLAGSIRAEQIVPPRFEGLH